MASGLRWDTSGLEDPRDLDKKIDRAMLGTVKYWSGPIEKHMKHKAPWTDRTTNARNGLFAKGRKLAASLYGIILGHSVDYGIYLELGTRYMRARPIVRPTMELLAPQVMATFSKLMGRL